MSDLTTNPLASFRAINNLNLLEKKADSIDTSPESSVSAVKETFQQMLMLTMMSGMSSSSSEGTNSSSMMLMPLMLSLMEKLISEQIESEDDVTAAVKVNAAEEDESDKNISRTGATGQPSGMPISGGRLTQGCHPGHVALDFGIPVGSDVKSTMDGKVVYAGWNNEGYGNLVIVENGAYRTYYAHLSEIPVHLGETVGAGATIGLSGNTGNSTGPHLHYEVRYNMTQIDPTSFTLSG